jgi:indolepyruvate ferredoxin oxidoreductase beta subunit
MQKMMLLGDEAIAQAALDADKIASDLGSGKVSNMVILGAATPFIQIPYEHFESGIRAIFGWKGEEMVLLNLEALRKGKEITEGRS